MAGEAAVGAAKVAARRKQLTDRVLLRELCLAWIQGKNHDRSAVGLDELVHHLFELGFPRAPSTIQRRLLDLEDVHEVEQWQRSGPAGWRPAPPRLDLAYELWETEQALDSRRRALAGRVDPDAPVPAREQQLMADLERDIARGRRQINEGLDGLLALLEAEGTPEARRERTQLRVWRDRVTRLIEECRVLTDRWLERLPSSEQLQAAADSRRGLERLEALADDGYLREAIAELEQRRRSPGLLL